jgi:ribonuclease P protein component
MLSFSHRFHGHGSLRYVYKNGQAIRSHLITIKYTKNAHRKHSRFAVVVSKKVHKSAVGRNRIRRRLYEIIRQELPRIQSPHDVVILVFSSEVLTMPHDELQALMQQLYQSSGLYK